MSSNTEEALRSRGRGNGIQPRAPTEPGTGNQQLLAFHAIQRELLNHVFSVSQLTQLLKVRHGGHDSLHFRPHSALVVTIRFRDDLIIKFGFGCPSWENNCEIRIRMLMCPSERTSDFMPNVFVFLFTESSVQLHICSNKYSTNL